MTKVIEDWLTVGTGYQRKTSLTQPDRGEEIESGELCLF